MYRKPKTTSELRANAAERAENGRSLASKGRRRKPPNAWDDIPAKGRIRQWRLVRRWVADRVRKGASMEEAYAAFRKKREFAGLTAGDFAFFWKWAIEDA